MKSHQVQGDSLFCFRVPIHLLGWRWKTHLPGANRVKVRDLAIKDPYFDHHNPGLYIVTQPCQNKCSDIMANKIE